MAPNSTFQEQSTPVEAPKIAVKRYEYEIVWKKVLFFAYIHYAGLWGLYYFLTFSTKWQTWPYVFILFQLSSIGNAVGAHRLFSHRTFKAKFPLRVFIAICQTLTFQKDIYDWCRDHRIHHQFSDTEADPHNATRGFWYSHMGWLLLKKQEPVISKGKALDLSDLEADPVVAFQRKYYWYIAPWVAFVIPAVIPYYFWDENLSIAYYTCSMFRYAANVNATSLVNSAAHLWGTRPYDKNILPVENRIVSHFGMGEGFHNYHHTFPWDYKAAELPTYHANWNAFYIDFFAKMGWAYDLKTVSQEMIAKRSKRTGDGSRIKEDAVWGWGDKTMSKEYKDMTNISYKRLSNRG